MQVIWASGVNKLLLIFGLSLYVETLLKKLIRVQQHAVLVYNTGNMMFNMIEHVTIYIHTTVHE